MDPGASMALVGPHCIATMTTALPCLLAMDPELNRHNLAVPSDLEL